MKFSNRAIFFLLLLITALPKAKADEGMWLPILINKYNIGDMQRLGCKLTAEQIYSINQACIKDAIVALDHGGCSGSIISEKGLLITNHHCGYDAIAEESSVEKDYLTNGFWAMRLEEELPLKGKSVSFLKRMEDVTSLILSSVPVEVSRENYPLALQQTIDSIQADFQDRNEGYEASIEAMFNGNEYYLFVYETFTDIRMVGAPPSNIGKFGGETDNWSWPRHTGDFCLLRIYANPENKPADYSGENQPYKPEYFLPISLSGIKENDFAFIMGYPGMTDRFLTSYGIRQKLERLNPIDSLMFTDQMGILKKYMASDKALQIAYASRYAYLANFQEKAIEESKALRRLNVIQIRQEEEDKFQSGLKKLTFNRNLYEQVIPEFEKIYKSKMDSRVDEAERFLMNLLDGSRIFRAAWYASSLGFTDDGSPSDDLREAMRQEYKNQDESVDKEITTRLLELYYQNFKENFRPEFFDEIDKKYKGDVAKWVDRLYSKSIFANKEQYEKFLRNPSMKKLEKDPAAIATISLIITFMETQYSKVAWQEKFDSTQMLYMAALQNVYPERKFYPDANSTLRLTYGQVKSYKPTDAVSYASQTTLKGILEKDNPQQEDFAVPAKLKQLYAAKDYGRYGKDGTLYVCFLTDNDITGGNSGSAVMNARGELIGVAFDGNSEALSSDIMFNEALQRTICVDIRYVLFVIDKFAGAGYLINEMKISE